MFKSWVSFLRFFLLWIAFFAVDRLIFLLHFTGRFADASFSEVSLSMLYGLRLDASMAAYVCALPLLLYLTQLWAPRLRLPAKLMPWYAYTLVIIFAVISVFNIHLYREWGSKINYRALDVAFTAPKEAAAASSTYPLPPAILLGLVIIALGVTLSRIFIDRRVHDRQAPMYSKLLISILPLALIILVARGGIQLSPINQSMAYYSSNIALNHAAVNTEWNLIQDVLNNKYGDENPYNYYPATQAKAIVDSLYARPEGPGRNVLTTTRPNIVLIIVESLTSRFVGALGGEPAITPGINALADSALLFTDIYASAGRTDKGIVATLSSFPSQAVRSIMKQNSKQEKLPAIAQDLFQNGYHTSFFYGGESEFFNMKSFLLSHGYQVMIDQYSFDRKDMNSKWGAYDEKVFQKSLEELPKFPQPFFSTLLTLTNHEPFELPVKHRFGTKDLEDKFRSTTYYTDSCLTDYLAKAKSTEWYKNTLFVIVADHSHRLPGEINEYDPWRYRIPLMLYGPALKPEYRGQRIEVTGSQTDINATLLSQLGLPYSRYRWSKDLLHPQAKGFAFFNWDNGFGFSMNKKVVSFDNVGRRIIQREYPADNKIDNRLLHFGKASMQEVFREYLEY